MKKIIMAVGLAFIMTGVFAQSAPSFATPQASPVSMAICPQISEIKKNLDQGNWSATTKYGFWQSYHRACSNNLTRFVGAQWVGANLGQVTCIYKADVQFTMSNQEVTQPSFPVLLVYHALAHQPRGLHWQHAGHGVYNCNSLKQQDCAFSMNLAVQSGNIFEEAESLKSTYDSAPSPLNNE